MEINEIFEIDWVDYICDKYKKIPENDKRIFWIIFTTLNLMFIFHTINFLWGCDDWQNIKDIMKFNDKFFEGRFFSSLLKTIFFQGQILPVLNNIFAFLGFSLGTIILFKYWELDNKVRYFVIAGVMFVCNPLTNAWLYFQLCVLEVFWAILFIAIGLKLISDNKISNTGKFYLKNIISILLFFTAISIYQPCINAIMVILFGKLIIKFLESKYKEMLVVFINSIINIAVSLSLYFCVYKICIAKNIINVLRYNQQVVNNIAVYANQLNLACGEIFNELYSYERILMPRFITKMFLLIIIIAIVASYKFLKQHDYAKIKFTAFFILLALMLLSTQISQIVSGCDIFGEPRIIFFGMLLFDIFMLVLVFKYAKLRTKNFTYLLCLILFFEYITVNFVSQKSLKFATISEVTRLNELVDRVERNKNFVQDKTYKLFVIGEFLPARDCYVSNFYGTYNWNLGSGLVTPNDKLEYAIMFYNNNIKISETFMYYTFYMEESRNIFYAKLTKDEDVIKKVKTHIDELKPWPNVNSVIIDGDLIILTLSAVRLESFKKEFSNVFFEWR